MPLLPELVSIKDAFYYEHGAPNGAVSPRRHPGPPEKAEKHPGYASPRSFRV